MKPTRPLRSAAIPSDGDVIHVVGGPTTLGAFIDRGLLDEPRLTLDEGFVSQQEDRGQAEPAPQHERRHQDFVVEVGEVSGVASAAQEVAQGQSRHERQQSRGKE